MSDKFIPGNYYHIFNRGNNRENIFYNEKNYYYFLEKLDKYLIQYLDIYAFCLLPNHFHLLVRIKENEKVTDSDSIDNYMLNISEQFRRFFITYSQSINKQQNRTGSLFQKKFKRKRINNIEFLIRLIYYIHLNPVLHKLSNSFENYPFSSYKIIISNKSTRLNRNGVIELFKNKEEFIKYHHMRLIEKKGFEDYFLE